MFNNKFNQFRTMTYCRDYHRDVGPRFVQKPMHSKWLFLFFNFSNILLNAPLSNLFWKTEKCRSKDFRGGAVSICLVKRKHTKLREISKKTKKTASIKLLSQILKIYTLRDILSLDISVYVYSIVSFCPSLQCLLSW